MSVTFTFAPSTAAGSVEPGLDSFFFEPESYLSQIRAAEAAGFDGLLLDEPSGLLGNIDLSRHVGGATATSGIIVTHWPGVMSPVAAAQELSAINHLLDGRLSVRILADTADDEREGNLAAVSTHEAAMRRTDEYLKLLKRLWLNDRPFDHEGPFYSVKKGYVPSKRGLDEGIVVRMSGSSGMSLQIAGRHAHIFELKPTSLFELRTMIRRVTAAAATYGRAKSIRFALPVTVVHNDCSDTRVQNPACRISLQDTGGSIEALNQFIEAGIDDFMISGLCDPGGIREFGKTIMAALRNSAVPLLGPAPDQAGTRIVRLERHAANRRWQTERDA